MTKIALVGFGTKQRNESAPARDMYLSSLFQAARDYADTQADHWYVLSARYGLVLPNRIIEPDPVNLAEKPHRERSMWASGVMRQLESLKVIQKPTVWILLANQLYTNALIPYLELTGAIEQPLAGMKMGHCITWLKSHTA